MTWTVLVLLGLALGACVTLCGFQAWMLWRLAGQVGSVSESRVRDMLDRMDKLEESREHLVAQAAERAGMSAQKPDPRDLRPYTRRADGVVEFEDGTATTEDGRPVNIGQLDDVEFMTTVGVQLDDEPPPPKQEQT